MWRKPYQEREGTPEMRVIPIMAFALLAIATACGIVDGELDPLGPPEESIAAPVEPAIDEDDVTVYFPRQTTGPIDMDDAQPRGVLTLDVNGCLRLGDDGPVIIWPNTGVSVELVEDDITVVEQETGGAIAKVGQTVTLHGREDGFPEQAPRETLDEPLPEACQGAGAYLVTGDGITGPEE